MKKLKEKKKSKKKGMAMVTSFGLLALVMIGATAYIDYSTSGVRFARLSNYEQRTVNLAEAGIEALLAAEWKAFKTSQSCGTLDASMGGASLGSPKATKAGAFADTGAFSASVIKLESPDTYTRIATIRSIGWIDHNGNNTRDSGEPWKAIDSIVEFTLKRSKVFDYAQFVNNYGWIKGFNKNSMIVNGDWRVNGDFDLLTGTATINGSIIAASNTKLTPQAVGKVNKTPYKWDDNTYDNYIKKNKSHADRMRPAYDPAIHGAFGTPEFEEWRDLVYYSESEYANGSPFGAFVQDANGTRSWKRTSPYAQYRYLDSKPSEEIVMPDLNNFGSPSDVPDPDGNQFAKSKAYKDDKATFSDGTPNPHYSGNPASANEFNGDGSPNQSYSGAFVDVWDPSLNSGAGGYKRASSNGIVNGSVLLLGTKDHPIKVHGPVTVNGDVAIGGYVEGQGTLYTARNLHIASSIKYKNEPNFKGSDPNKILADAEKADVLGLAARGSVMIGDPDTYTSYEFDHMKPPFTRDRIDEDGNNVPAFNYSDVDGWGVQKYQSLLKSDASAWAAFKAEANKGVNQIDAVLYTNNTIGGQAGYQGGGMTVNGSMICKDLAIVAYSSPIRLNYDSRIKDRGGALNSIIDIDLPRGPAVKKLSWEDKGFHTK